MKNRRRVYDAAAATGVGRHSAGLWSFCAASRRGETAREKPREGRRARRKEGSEPGRRAKSSAKRSCHRGGPLCAKRAPLLSGPGIERTRYVYPRRFKKQTTPYRAARSIRYSGLEARFANFTARRVRNEASPPLDDIKRQSY